MQNKDYNVSRGQRPLPRRLPFRQTSGEERNFSYRFFFFLALSVEG